MAAEPRLGSKIFYKIGEVGHITKLPAYEEGYTIAGLKRFWAKRGRQARKEERPQDVARRLRGNLQAILRILDSRGPVAGERRA